MHTTVTSGGLKVGGITKISFFCEHYNGLLLNFITHCFLLLACLRVGIVYILVKKIMFSILIHNQKNFVVNVYILVQKVQDGWNWVPTKKWIEQVIIYPLWYDIISCNITDRWMLKSSLYIKNWLLIFQNSSEMTSATAISLMGGCWHNL